MICTKLFQSRPPLCFFHIVHPGHMKQPRRTNTFHQLKSTKSCKATRSRHDHCSVSITQAMGNWHNNCPCLYEQPILIHFTRSHGLSTRFLPAQIDILTPKNRGWTHFCSGVFWGCAPYFVKRTVVSHQFVSTKGSAQPNRVIAQVIATKIKGRCQFPDCQVTWRDLCCHSSPCNSPQPPQSSR